MACIGELNVPQFELDLCSMYNAHLSLVIVAAPDLENTVAPVSPLGNISFAYHFRSFWTRAELFRYACACLACLEALA